MKNLATMAGFNTIYWWLVIVAYFFGPPCMSTDCPQSTVKFYRVLVLKMYKSEIKMFAIHDTKQCDFTKCTYIY